MMLHTTRTTSVSAMKRSDLEYVVALHRRSFPASLLSQMGPRVLRCLYQGVVSDPSGIAYVCEKDHRILGFVAGTGESRDFYKRLLARRWHRFAFASVVPVLKDPGIVPRLLDAFRKTTEEPDEEGGGLLMSLAVEPDAQSEGIGTALVHGFLGECRNLGLYSVHLTTDHFGNDRTNRFYLNLGFTVSRVTTTPQGRVLNDYRIEIG